MRAVLTVAALVLLLACGAAIVLLLRGGDDEAGIVLTLQASDSGPGRASPRALLSDERAYEGSTSYLAETPGDSADVNKFARAVLHRLGWGAGTDVWYGAAFFLPPGFYAAQQGQIDLMRWDNFVLDRESTDRGGVVVYGGEEAGRAYLIRARLGGDQDELVGPFVVSEGEWHWVEVHQRFSPDHAGDVSEVFLDGTLVGRSTKANWYGRPITSIRFGLVATPGGQSEPLRLWFDRVSVSPERTGPLD